MHHRTLDSPGIGGIASAYAPSVSPLIWTEFRPDLGEFDEFQHPRSAAAGRVLKSHYQGPDVPIRLIMTADGVEWSELPLPDGFHVADLGSDADPSIDIAGDRWIAFGWDVTRDPHENVGREVWFSDDQGSSWIEANIETPQRSEPLPPYAIEESAVLEALAWGDRLIVVARTITRLDLEALLSDRGLVPSGKILANWLPSGRGFTLTLSELPPEGEPARRGRDRWRLQELEMSPEDLGLSIRQQELLQKRQETVIRIYAGDGPSLPMAAEYERWVYKITGTASAEGIVLATQGEWETLLTSADGLAWVEEPLGSVELWAAGGGDGALWAAGRTRKAMRIDRIRYRDGQATVALKEDVKNLSSFAAGRAGVVLAGLTGRSAKEEPGLMRTRVRKAGRTYTHGGHGDYRADELWLGWSTDGDTFEWQPASEAFGVDPRRRISVRLAVGKDFFLAEVSDFGIRPKIPRDTDIGFNPNPADGWIPAAVPRHWFMARVG